MKTLLTLGLLLALAVPACAQSLTTTTAAVPATVTRGQTSTVTSTLKNPLLPKPPTTLTATVTYDDEYGVEHTAAASTTIAIAQPVKPKSYRWTMPALFEFVAGSARLDGVAVTPAVSGSELTIPITRALNEGETCVVVFGVRAK